MTTNFPVPIPRSALGRGLLALGAALASALLVLTGSTQAHAIVGGYEAKPLQFPSVLALQKNGQLICGATLIKPGWALTSAACTTGSAPSQLKVVSGALALTDLSIPGITTVQVAQIVLHPDYAASDGRNNIALLKLNTPSSPSLRRFRSPAPRSPARSLPWAGAQPVREGSPLPRCATSTPRWCLDRRAAASTAPARSPTA